MAAATAIEEVVLLDDTGAEVRLGDLWRDRPTAIVFLRHFGCTFCREHAAELQTRLDEVRDAGGTAVAIGMGRPEHAADFRERSGIEFQLLVSPDTSLHERMGLTRGNWVRVFAGIRRVNAIRKYGAKRTGADMSQLGGTFVVAPGGELTFEHRAGTSGDNASLDETIAAIRSAAGVPEPAAAA